MIKAICIYFITYLYAILSTLLYMPYVFLLVKLHVLSHKKGKNMLQNNAKRWAKLNILVMGTKVSVSYEKFEAINDIKDEAIVIVSNHQSKADIPLLLGYFIRPIGFVAKIELKNMPILKYWMQMLDCIFLDRSDARSAIKTMQEGAALIAREKACISIFPEGTRGSEIISFKKGSFKLAFMSKGYLVPIVIKGTDKLSSSDKIKAGKADLFKLHIGTPISMAHLTKEEKEALPETVENWVRENFNKL
ncbi:MAG: lysophospholipid acyltransferase family protein [Fusobacteria bacterium]|nr:lysophospholipid acyltransferase family protein [Fusobacteriota bacterium]